MDVVATIAPTRANVLLQGESGTGKRRFARAIHDQSLRAGGPFVTINCAALPEGLVESAFGQARGGTLLLDQITEMRIDLQSHLLGVMQEQADVRLIGTTNRDLKAEVDAGRFRDDLYYRLNLMPIRMPPLRERIEDIPRLVHHFLERVAERLGMSAPTVAPETIQTLQAYGWPGNVRELSEAIERAAIYSRNGTLLPSHLGGQLGQPAASGSGREQEPFNLDELERIAIARALAETRGNRTRAAKLLGISERTLRNKLNGPKATTTKG
jgi:DNA-binding NtrC family response regulator